ncbi:hypothetical protein [Thalassospira marina]|uniref:Uncharacterized protein n=1 Tax=Thalassospira marina TaxID=2048283 RepID=A0ABN5FKP9_9PROT|nr:hypothetical protein [Thalassospira marina]AUG53947.1 hypothetical protein CSC3H3_15385 [Thalassospira marina]
MAFDPNLPNTQQQDLESVLGAIRGNENNLNDRIKAQEDLSLATTKNEVTAARGSRATLNERLNVALDAQGNVKFDSLKNMTWIASGDVPTYVNAQSFTVPGDQTTKYLSGLVLRLMHGTTQIHSVVSVASYVAGTDKTTVSLQQTLLTPALSSILIGLASLGEVLYEEALLKAIPTEPAWRSETPPCLFDLAVPGQPLDAPFEFSRPGKGIGFNARGQYTMVENGTQRDWFDPETQEYKGKLTLPAYRSSCANWNATPTDLTGIQGPYGDANAIVSVQDDAEELGKIHILKQLLREGTLNGNVFKVDNSLGSSSVFVLVDGNTGSPGAVTTISAWCRTTNGGRVDMAGGFGAQNFTNTGYERIHKTVDLPDNKSGKCAIIAEAGSTVWFILNQCEVSAAPSFVPVITQGAAAVTTADVLTIGPVESTIVFDQDFTASINGVFPVNDCVISQDETRGLVVFSPTTGAVIAGIDVPASWQGKRFRLLFNADNGYSRSFHFIGAGGVKLGHRQINPGYAGDITIPYGTLELHLRADSVASNTDIHWADLKLTELIPFEGWDSNAKGHTFLIDAFSPLGTDSATNLMQVYDDTNTNTIEIYEFRHGDVKDIRSSYRVGTDRLFCDTTADASDELTVLRTEHETLSVKSASSPLQTTSAENRYPPGLCRILFGKLWWGPQSELTIKRFAVYNLPLSDSDLNAMVTK